MSNKLTLAIARSQTLENLEDKCQSRELGTTRSVLLITADEQEIKRLRDLKNQPKEWIYCSRVQKVK